MGYNHVYTIVLASALAAAAAVTATAAAAESLYVGVWDVTIVTKSGSCEAAAHSTLTVTDGRISGPGADVSGSIGRAGLVRVTIRGAYANGQISGNTGSGKWNGASAGVPCSGRWEASRQQSAAELR
jgi:hypothetical protein